MKRSDLFLTIKNICQKLPIHFFQIFPSKEIWREKLYHPITILLACKVLQVLQPTYIDQRQLLFDKYIRIEC